jgi:hypothetical protein
MKDKEKTMNKTMKKKVTDCVQKAMEVVERVLVGLVLFAASGVTLFMPTVARAERGPSLAGTTDLKALGEFQVGLAERSGSVTAIIAELEKATSDAEKAPPDRRRLLRAIASTRFREAMFNTARELRAMSSSASEVTRRHLVGLRTSVRSNWPALFRDVSRRGSSASGLTTSVVLAMTLRGFERALDEQAGRLEVEALQLDVDRVRDVQKQIAALADRFRALTGAPRPEPIALPPSDPLEDWARETRTSATPM